MTDLKRLTEEWLDIVARGDIDAWDSRVASDVVMRLPFAPPGVPEEIHGYDQVRKALGDASLSHKSFQWRDVVVRLTEESDLVVVTCRSEVELTSGAPYANSYVLLVRFRDRLVVEHVEYFNPLKVLESFSFDQK